MGASYGDFAASRGAQEGGYSVCVLVCVCEGEIKLGWSYRDFKDFFNLCNKDLQKQTPHRTFDCILCVQRRFGVGTNTFVGLLAFIIVIDRFLLSEQDSDWHSSLTASNTISSKCLNT